MSEALRQALAPRHYTVTFANGSERRFEATRSHMEDGVLRLFHRPSPEAAEELVVALVLANVRMWSKA